MNIKLIFLGIGAVILIGLGVFLFLQVAGEPESQIDESVQTQRSEESDEDPVDEKLEAPEPTLGGTVTVPEDWGVVESEGLTVQVPPNYLGFANGGVMSLTITGDSDEEWLGALEISQGAVSQSELQLAKERIERLRNLSDGAAVPEEQTEDFQVVKVRNLDLGVCGAVMIRGTAKEGTVEVVTECVQETDDGEVYFVAHLTYGKGPHGQALEEEYNIIVSSIDLG